MGVIVAKTADGLEFHIDERIKNDWRLITAVKDAESENPVKKMTGTVELVQVLIGEDGEKRLRQHIMSKNEGYCPIDAIRSAITEIMNSLKESSEEIKK